MIELYILRHGQTTWNAARRIQGSTDIELNEKGRQAARNTGKAWEDMLSLIHISEPTRH